MENQHFPSERNRSRNIVDLLIGRETSFTRPSATILYDAENFQENNVSTLNATDNTSEHSLSTRSSRVRNISPDGRYRLTFEDDQRSVHIYEKQDLMADERAFRLRHSVDVCEGNQRLTASCILFTTRNYVIVGSSEDRGHERQLNPVIMWRSLSDVVLHLIDLRTGLTNDILFFPDDDICLTDNQCLYMCHDFLCVLSLATNFFEIYIIDSEYCFINIGSTEYLRNSPIVHRTILMILLRRRMQMIDTCVCNQLFFLTVLPEILRLFLPRISEETITDLEVDLI